MLRKCAMVKSRKLLVISLNKIWCTSVRRLSLETTESVSGMRHAYVGEMRHCNNNLIQFAILSRVIRFYHFMQKKKFKINFISKREMLFCYFKISYVLFIDYNAQNLKMVILIGILRIMQIRELSCS